MDQIFFQWGVGESGVGGHVGFSLDEEVGDGGVAVSEHVGDEAKLVPGGCRVGLSEDGSYGGSHHFGVASGHPG